MCNLTLLLVVALSAACIEMDIAVPSFPDMQAHFNASIQEVQSTLSLNFLGFCLSAMLYGPLTECFGRRKLMLIGSGLFLIGASACALSFNIKMLIFSRFIQGLGGSASFVIAFAMVADVYKNEEATKQIGKMNALLTAFVAIAPILGGLINEIFYWRANFIFIALMALFSAIFLHLYLPETKPKEEFKKFSFNILYSGYKELVLSKKFLLYAFIPNVLVAAYLTYVGCAAFYYMQTCGFTTAQFAINQGVVVGTFSLFSFYTSSLTKNFGVNNCKIWGIILSLIGVSSMLMISFIAPYAATYITISMVLFAIGAALSFAIIFAESLNIFPNLVGDASAFIQATRLLVSFITVEIAGRYYNGTFQSTAITMSVCLILGVLAIGYIYRTEMIVECEEL